MSLEGLFSALNAVVRVSRTIVVECFVGFFFVLTVFLQCLLYLNVSGWAPGSSDWRGTYF